MRKNFKEELPSCLATWLGGRTALSLPNNLSICFSSVYSNLPVFRHFLPRSALSHLISFSYFHHSSLSRAPSLSLSISLSSSRHVFCVTASWFFSHIKLLLSVSCFQSSSCSFMDKRLISRLFQTGRSYESPRVQITWHLLNTQFDRRHSQLESLT